MQTRHSDAEKLKILKFAKKHGVVAAAQHYNINSQLISQWNRKFRIYAPKPANYSRECKIQVLTYARDHGARAAAKKFGVSENIVSIWNAELKVYTKTVRIFNDGQRRTVLLYARDYGIAAAADKFDVNPSTIIRWNKKYKIYEGMQEYTPRQISDILTYARDHGVAAAAAEFNVAKYTLNRWNKKYQIYTRRVQPDYVAYNADQQQEILRYALEIYNSLPADKRSAWAVLTEIAPRFNATRDQLYVWNRKFKIVPVRAVRRRTPSQDEIDAVQNALNTSRNRIAAAARKSGTTEYQIKKMLNKKQVKFRAATDKVASRVPVGAKKSRLISSIIQSLISTKNQ